MKTIAISKIISRFNEGISDLASAERASRMLDERNCEKHLRDAGEALSQATEWALWHCIKVNYLALDQKPATIKGLIDYYIGKNQLRTKKRFDSDEEVNFEKLVQKKGQLTNIAKHQGGKPDFETQKWYAKETSKFIKMYIDPEAHLSTIEKEMEITNDTWGTFYDACDKFKEDGRNLILVIGDGLRSFDEGYLKQLALPKWNLIIDYDFHSESEGFFHKVYANDSTKPHKITVAEIVSNEDISQFSRTHYHFFANNFAGLGLKQETDFKQWDRRYGKNAEGFLKSFGEVFSNQKNIVLILHKSRRDINFVCENIQRYFDGDNLFVLADDFENTLSTIQDDFDAFKIDISMADIMDGLQKHSSNFIPDRLELNSYLIPYIKDTETATSGELSLNEYARLEEYFEVVHTKLPDNYDQQPMDFMSGKERISWGGLKLNFDVEPKDFDREYVKKVSEAFANTRGKLVLLHEPGYGGSTIARRIAWHFHTEYPTLILKKYSESKVKDLIVNLHEKTRKTIFVIMEIPQSISQDEANVLFSSIPRPVVFLMVKRGRITKETKKDTSMCVTDWGNDIQALTSKYIPFLKNRYKEGSPPYKAKIEDMEGLRMSNDPEMKTPFYVGLITFERDFRGIKSYISNFVTEITQNDTHKRLIAYLALCDSYLGMGLPANILRSIVKADSEGVFDLEKYFEGSSFITSNLLYCDNQNPRNRYWKIRHSFFSRELLAQLLGSGSDDPDYWKCNLADTCESFIQDTVSEAESSDYLHEILQKLFIGTNTDRSGDKFTTLITDIRTPEGKEQIFKRLADLYPENPHYCSHLARLYAYDPKLKNTERAIELADRAITISERIGRKDHLLYHIKGMCLRANVYEKIATQISNINRDIPVDQDEYDNIIHNLIPRTGMQFEISRKIASDLNKSDEYGFVAHIQLLVRAIDFGAKVSDRTTPDFIAKDINPFSEWLDLAETLLSEVKRISSGDDRDKIEDCENDILAFYGQYSQIIQNLTNILNKSQRPTIIRRQLVRAYSRKNKEYFNDVKTIRNMMSYMEDNIIAEPENEKNYYLWFQAARHSSMPLAEVINKMSQWRTVSTTIDASFYLYILKTLRALDGYSEAMYEAKELIGETKAKGKSNIKPTEWLGKGKGLNQLVHYRDVTEANRDSKLQLVEGIFTGYRHSGNGVITIANGIEVFFNPTQAKLTSSDLNARVSFYLGFSYDGPKADSTSVRLQ
jgi:hypothetical protein